MSGRRERLEPAAVLVEAGRLAAAGRPFVLATVTSVRRPASARIGDRGIVTEDGRLAGWVGGACSEPAVVRERIEREAKFDPDLWVLSVEMRGDDPGVTLVKG